MTTEHLFLLISLRERTYRRLDEMRGCLTLRHPALDHPIMEALRQYCKTRKVQPVLQCLHHAHRSESQLYCRRSDKGGGSGPDRISGASQKCCAGAFVEGRQQWECVGFRGRLQSRPYRLHQRRLLLRQRCCKTLSLQDCTSGSHKMFMMNIFMMTQSCLARCCMQ